MPDDPELERRLEAMFSSARPRGGFEEELWQKIEARRPWHQRLGRRFQPAFRYAPALAALLVVALGVTWVAGNFRGRLGGSSATSSSGAAPAFGIAKAPAPAFGVLPPLSSGAARSASTPQTATAGGGTGSGIAFSGTLPNLPAELPVYRYDEPTAADRASAAVALKAQSGLAAIKVTASDAARGLEPAFVFNAPATGGSPGGPVETANAFLAGHSLTPRFAFQLTLASSGSQVIYGRVFDGPQGSIRQVRRDGSAAGLTVDLSGGTVSAQGPLDLPLAAAPYPLRSASEAFAAASPQQPGGPATFDRAELVYLLVVAGSHGYYEPALLLTGSGQAVLAPVIAAAWLGT